MISFEEALERVKTWSQRASPMAVESVSLARAPGRVLGADARAQEPYPRFDNSAVDGYAIGCAEDGQAGSTLQVAARVRAGDAPLADPVAPGTAVRIFTGAPVPPEAWGIVMQEDVDALDDGGIVVRAEAHPGQHIRRAGSDIASGEVVLEAGERINAGHVALLATLGIPEPSVRARVPVAVITTGDELVDASVAPGAGQIRDSNGPMLYSLGSSLGCDVSAPRHVRDSGEALEGALREAAASHRIVVMTGGASVGEHDFAPSVAARLGEVLFHGVAIRPGKPILFAALGDTALFALPGNPAATFVGFHLFVRECVAGLLRERYEPRWFQVRFMNEHRTRERDDFLRATLDWTSTPPEARATQEQGSFALR
ncbi:MAG: molybdopterin molybdotransferase MoeA, partial [Armatimonadota bacterium]